MVALSSFRVMSELSSIPVYISNLFNKTYDARNVYSGFDLSAILYKWVVWSRYVLFES